MDRLRLGLVAVVVGNKTHIYQNGAKHRVERKASQWLQPSPGGLVAPCWQLETRNLMSLLGRVVFHWFCVRAVGTDRNAAVPLGSIGAQQVNTPHAMSPRGKGGGTPRRRLNA